MIVEATNCHRAYAANLRSMAADFVSHVIDFKDMTHGSIHVRWSNVSGTLDGTFKIYASDFPDEASFDPDGTEIDGATFSPHNTDGSRIWLRDRLSMRYTLVRYTKVGILAGTCDIVAIGKKG